MFLVRDLGVMVLPERGQGKGKGKDGNFTTCGGYTCLGDTNCGPHPCDCGERHSCNPGGTCANNTRKCVGRSMPKTKETEVEVSLDAIEFYLAELRKQLKGYKGKAKKKAPKRTTRKTKTSKRR